MNVIRNRYVVVALGLLAMMAALIVAIPPIEADTTTERLDERMGKSGPNGGEGLVRLR